MSERQPSAVTTEQFTHSLADALERERSAVRDPLVLSDPLFELLPTSKRRDHG